MGEPFYVAWQRLRRAWLNLVSIVLTTLRVERVVRAIERMLRRG